MTRTYVSGVMALMAVMMVNVIAMAEDAKVLDFKGVTRGIIFFANLERVREGYHPVVYDPRLEKAAYMQAEFCAANGRLSHMSDKGTPGDRIKQCGVTAVCTGENAIESLRFPMPGVSSSPLRDDENNADYDKNAVRWYTEDELAGEMISRWMQSVGHRGNLLDKDYTRTGAGIACGEKDEFPIVYGIQVFTDGNNDMMDSFNAEVMERDNTLVVTVTYGGPLQVESFTCVKGRIRLIKSRKTDEKKYYMEISPAEKGEIFTGLYDPSTGMHYPMKLIPRGTYAK